jgi:hypothetical protein
MPQKILKRITDNWHIKLVAVILAALLYFYVGGLKEKERFITVPFEIRNVPQGYTVSSDTPPYVKIVLKGEETALALVNERDIKAYVEAGKERPAKVKGIVKIDSKGVPPGVTVKEVQPRTVELTVEDLVTRSVEVTPVIVGKPAAGRVLTDVFTNPLSVRIRGPATVVNGVKSVHTEGISVEGLYETTVAEAKLELEDGKVALLGDEPMRVTIVIEEEYVVRQLGDLPIELRGLPAGFRAAVDPAFSSALVKIPRRLEDRLSRKAVHVYIDAEVIQKPGTLQLPLLFMTDIEHAELVRLDPQYVDVSAEALKRFRK